MIETSHLLPLLVPAYPCLKAYIAASADTWLGDAGEIRACPVFSTIGNVVEDRFKAFEFEGAERLFNVIELCLVEGSQDVKDAAATCFLENLINCPDIGAIAVGYMGPKALEHCRAWDRFTGVTTLGLGS